MKRSLLGVSGLLAALLAYSGVARADLELPSIIADNMVLQRDRADAVWGWDAPGGTVKVSFRGQSVSATCDAGGKWTASVPAGDAGGPFDLTISGSNTVTLRDVLVGEVWIAGGQSNMWWHVSNCRDYANVQAAAKNPQLRYWDADTSPNQAGWPAATPQHSVQANWLETTSDNVGNFAGVPYFFGKELQAKLGMPVGIINLSVPGMEIEQFLSPDYLKVNLPQAYELQKLRAETYPQDKAAYDQAHAAWVPLKTAADAAHEKAPPEPKAPADPASPYQPGSLYNGTVAPAIPYTGKGFIWWQGEYNADRFTQYRVLFPGLIEEWRQKWGDEKLPFLFVELHGWLNPQSRAVEEDTWPDLRDAQREGLRLPDTYEVSSIDVLGTDSIWTIHPTNKQLIGHRLFVTAWDNVYGQPGPEWSGPVFRSAKFDGNSAVLHFEHADGLAAKDGGALKGFAVAGADHVFEWANASVSGSDVTVTALGVVPVAVRYGWANNPNGNLVNAAGLPAFAFRTDSWNLGLTK